MRVPQHFRTNNKQQPCIPTSQCRWIVAWYVEKFNLFGHCVVVMIGPGGCRFFTALVLWQRLPYKNFRQTHWISRECQHIEINVSS